MNTTRQKVLSSLTTLVIFLVPTVSVQTPAKAQDATILLYSDPRPGQSADGETALTEDFNQADDQIPSGWTLDCAETSVDERHHNRYVSIVRLGECMEYHKNH